MAARILPRLDGGVVAQRVITGGKGVLVTSEANARTARLGPHAPSADNDDRQSAGCSNLSRMTATLDLISDFCTFS